MTDTFEFTLDEESEKKLFEIMTDFNTEKIPSFTITDKYGHTAKYMKVVRCKDCKYWQTDDGTFPDFDGRPWHECKCLYMFRAPDGEPARTTADFWCGYGERRKEE